MSNYIESLEWRYATKKFDQTKKVSNEDIETLKKALQLSASSYGIQGYKFVVVENQEIKKQLRPAAWNQSQLEDASHVFVLCARTQIEESDVDIYLNDISKTRGVPVDQLAEYGGFMKNSLKNMPAEINANWSAKQVYIALSNLLSACADLRIDSCPMEGFEPEKFDEILGLKELNITSTVVIPVGYRSEEDQNQHMPKVRKPIDELFITK